MKHPRIYSCLVIICLLAGPTTVRSQSCTTGIVDERVADFLKKLGPVQMPAQIEKLRNDGPKSTRNCLKTVSKESKSQRITLK